MILFTSNHGSRFGRHATAVLASAFLVSIAATDSVARGIEPPKYNVVDRHGVNVASNQVQVSQTDLSIGGERGLTHVVSTYASDFVNYWGSSPAIPGFRDNLRGALYGKLLDKNNNTYNPSYWSYAFTATDGSSSADFMVTSTGSYAPLDDPTSTLDYVNEPGFTGYLWVDGSGKEVRFPSGNRVQATLDLEAFRAPMSSVVHPNGFRRTVVISGTGIDSPIYSVRTNTGFQLKYHYADDNRAVPADVAADPGNPYVPGIWNHWDHITPSEITALNNRYESCSDSLRYKNQCNLATSWPSVKYQWPAGMPRALFVKEGDFVVTTPDNVQTKYRHKVYEAQSQELGPRVIKITRGGAVEAEYGYRFTQHATITYYSFYSHSITAGPAELYESWRDTDLINHYQEYRQFYNDFVSGSTGYNAVSQVQKDSEGMMDYVDSWDAKYMFTHDCTGSCSGPGLRKYTSRVKEVIDKLGNITTRFFYDDRNNITRKEIEGSSGSLLVEQQGFPTSCTNRKTCNQPSWFRDARGNQTDFTYHAASGQVARITRPPNEKGVRPVTAYTYKEYAASYPGSDGSTLWLLDTESYCRNSAMSGSSCAAGDKVTITYEYEPANLLLVGKKVTAQGEATTLLTCYEYDRLGNQVGELPPEANASKSTCVQ